MVTGSGPTLYIRLRKRLTIRRGDPVVLGQVAQMLVDTEYEPALQMLLLHHPQVQEGNMLLVDMMLIVSKVKKRYPFMQIEHFGEPHCLIEIMDKRKRTSLVWVAFVWLLLFIGSGLAIMNFHADVSMSVVHQHIYKLITGEWVQYPLLLQIPYSFGIGLGMIIFFNHLFKKKFSEEPSPLELEMFMYQENVNYYVITEEYCKIQETEDTQ
ncbi:stage V sporulation protein AA [Paenibacillus agricola]|uniref:Stage V sporulation protein AA n=1 Tax=Paenibacillus agricola TaxID=2716264 RepID=A0ABX0IZZ3_9BACL|nr:stage V sporulation protein AA [Paenibacillus agricola]NHN28780.1 stage V sporulation protein AA [Paenibacillus agricola]